MNYQILTKTDKLENGLLNLKLESYVDGKLVDTMYVNSGSPYKQTKEYFRTVPNEHRQENEPVPEGEYDLGPLEWAAKDDKGKGYENYEKQFIEVQSPIWITIYRRRDIGYHMDGNRATAPGSAGCVVFKSMTDLKHFVEVWKKYGGFSKLYVNWGLNYVKLPTPNLLNASINQSLVQTPSKEVSSVVHVGGNTYNLVKDEKEEWGYPLVKKLFDKKVLAGRGELNGETTFKLDQSIDYQTAVYMIAGMMNKYHDVLEAVNEIKEGR